MRVLEQYSLGTRHMLQETGLQELLRAVCASGRAHAGGVAECCIGVAAHVPPRCPSRRRERGEGVEDNAITGHMPVTTYAWPAEPKGTSTM